VTHHDIMSQRDNVMLPRKPLETELVSDN